MMSEAYFEWHTTTDILEWDQPIYLLGAQTGGRWRVEIGTAKLEHDGAMLIASIQRAPAGEMVAGITVADSCAQSEAGVVLAVRFGDWIIFRSGHSIGNGQIKQIFDPFAGGGGGHVHATEDLTSQINGVIVDFDTLIDFVPGSLKVFVNGVHQGVDGGGDFVELTTRIFRYLDHVLFPGERLFVEFIRL
jgi:hypothetical protein